jgi:beta-xylosidase
MAGTQAALIQSVENPVLWSDFPDPDVIRVGDTYYMISTTMHFMPGAVLLRSYDLGHWEIVSHVFSVLDDYPAARLEDGKNIYGSGMWAASLRYYDGLFYVLFCANDTHRTYLFTAAESAGPWKRHEIQGFFYDASLLFDDDGKVYVVHGNTTVRITELSHGLDSVKTGGLDACIVQGKTGNGLGYEGNHIYKINGRYYLFSIYWPKGSIRTEVCFTTDNLKHDWIKEDVLCDDMNYYHQGVAQGGIVDTPDGKWYAMLFQDRGAAGRMPVLVPFIWNGIFPLFGESGNVPVSVSITSTNPGYVYSPWFGSDDFVYPAVFGGTVRLKEFWEWNHIPDSRLWSVEDGNGLCIQTGSVRQNVVQAQNTLTQRLPGPLCEACVTVDGSLLNDGDYAGLCAFQSCYGFIGLKKTHGKIFLVIVEKTYGKKEPYASRSDFEKGTETSVFSFEGTTVEISFRADFQDMKDTVVFYYKCNGQWKKIGKPHRLYFMLDHFTGCRAALFIYATEKAGGKASFSDFRLSAVSPGESQELTAD